MEKRNIFFGILFFIAFSIGATLMSFIVWSFVFKKIDTIKVGVLHSLSGGMEKSEKPVVDATLMAIDEINAKGGLLGRKLEPLVVDGKTNWSEFALQAEYLITQKKVDVIFGCWTSSSRKEVRPIVEKYNNLLFYPVQYEGVEFSPNIIYTGSTPNQQIIPGVNWCFDNLGSTYFIVGSDYIYPRVAGVVIRQLLTSLGAEILGEEYLVLGSNEVDELVAKIKEAKPDVILNNFVGETNASFFKALRAAGISSKDMPTMSFSMSEAELQNVELDDVKGDYAAWSYFQSIDSETNHDFVKRFKEKHGQDRVVNDPMEAAYCGVYFWSQAVFLAQSSDPNKVRKTIKNQVKKAPEGMIYVDGFNHHTWKFGRVGKITNNGQFDILWSSGKSIYPIIYPYKSEAEWNNILNDLHMQWGGRWSKE